ncbi:hypothetical protein DFH09DRAFT_1414655 [Mycena vulgaris]|nr:hypothetical protein DFH09DRAFT_1414655 [Mycena vulgaris]
MKLTIWAFIKGQFSKQAPVAKADLTGKPVIVLSANTGLGFEAAKHFAGMNPGRLILACRREKIDLTTYFSSVKQFADKFEQDGGRLDILVENVGVTTDKSEATTDGWEVSFVTRPDINILSPLTRHPTRYQYIVTTDSLITSQISSVPLSTPLVGLLLVLLPHMTRTAQEHATVPGPHIIVVTSELHYLTDIPKSVCEGGNILATLGSAEYCIPATMQNYYMLMKLLNVLFVRALNDRLGAAPLVVSAVNPAFCYSELRRDFSGAKAFLISIMERILAFTTEEGSHQLVWAAVGLQDSPDKLRGEYINQCIVEEPSDFIVSPEGAKAQDRIWVSDTSSTPSFLTIRRTSISMGPGALPPQAKASDLAACYAPLKKTLTIANMEAQENDLPLSTPFVITRFITVKFKPAGTREFTRGMNHTTRKATHMMREI